MNTFRAVSEVPRGIMQSISILRAFKPDQVLGVGGYASGPTLAAALIMRIPTAIHEQNSVLGTTNRILARFVDRIFTSWEHTEPEPPRYKTVMAGNPIRGDLLESLPPRNDRKKFHLLIFGGSQGARSINVALMENLDKLAPSPERIAILHQVGSHAAEDMRKIYEKAGLEADVRGMAGREHSGDAQHEGDRGDGDHRRQDGEDAKEAAPAREHQREQNDQQHGEAGDRPVRAGLGRSVLEERQADQHDHRTDDDRR